MRHPRRGARAPSNAGTAAAPAARHAGPALLPWAVPALLLVAAVEVLLGGRDLNRLFDTLSELTPPPRPALEAWVQRGVSLLLLLACADQVARHLRAQRPVPAPALLGAFVAYWCGAVAAPALFGAHPQASHDLAYALALGLAACLAGPQEHERLLRLARDALLALMAVGLLLAPLRPTLVMATHYADGLLPGLPRLAGLTPHPVTLGMLALVALLLVWARPPASTLARRAALLLALAVLVMAQSKAAWIAAALAGLAMAGVRRGPLWRRRLADPRGSGFGVLACLGAAALVAAAGGLALAGDALPGLADLLGRDQGLQLATLSGRDRIWAIAAQEWRDHPVFGYGLSLWDGAYRASIGLPHATHAHNQLLDDAARAGGVGVAALALYALALVALSLRQARASGGLAPALLAVVAVRSVSEVPLSLKGYGSELFVQVLLLATLAATAPPRRALPRPAPLGFGVTP